MSLELTYHVGQPHIIPLSAHLQKKLVWSGHNVLLSTLQQELHHDSFDPVKSELDNAYHVTCSIVAEYHCMEEAAANMAAMSDICCDSQTAVYVPALAKLNASAAIDWLQQNYEEQDSISLPRGALYSHYLDFCQEANIEPMNQASLGKVIRSIFPDVKTRRLGTRGQSKYHYYGMGIRDCSPYKDVMQHAQRFSGLCSSVSCKTVSGGLLGELSMSQSPALGSATSTRSWLQNNGSSSPAGIMLPDFPTIGRICISSDIQDKVAVLLMMYKHHCQRVITSVLHSCFTQVRDQLVQFWQCLPPRVTCVLTDCQVISLVALCDVQLYKTVASLLVPTVLQPLSSSLLSSVHSLADDLVMWLSSCHGILPEALRLKKLQVARAFSLCLRRRAGISQMATVARAFLHSADMVHKLHRDWKQLDITAVAHECCTLVDDDVSEQHRQQYRIRKCLHEFEKLLYQHSTVDRYLAWVHSLVHSCVFQVAQDKKLVLPSVGRQFLLTWTFVLKVILKDLTLVSADMFGSYHLLGMMFTDYIMYLIEQKERSRMTEHLACVIYRGLAPDWVEEGKDEEASVIGGNYFVRDPIHPIASDCAPSEQLYNAVGKSEGRMSAWDTAGSQLGFSHLSLGQWSALVDHRCRNDTIVNHGDVDGAGITFDVTIPTSLTRSSSIDSRNATWCVDKYQGCGAPGSRVEDSRHHVSTDPLMTDPCLVAPPLSGGSRPRQVMLPYSTSESFSACLDHVTDTLSSTDCGWYQPASSESRHYSSSDGWCTRTAADYSLKPSDVSRVHDTTTSQWCSGSSVNHDAAHSCYGNSAWYYSGGEQAGSTKLASTKKIQQVRCVDMPVTNGNAVCVGGTDTVAVDSHGGRAFVGEQLESPSYRMQERAGSRCYQWRQPCTTTSGATVWMTTSPCSQRLVIHQSDTLVTHSH